LLYSIPVKIPHQDHSVPNRVRYRNHRFRGQRSRVTHPRSFQHPLLSMRTVVPGVIRALAVGTALLLLQLDVGLGGTLLDFDLAGTS